MAHMHISTKRIQISKANSTMIITIAVASVITVFSLVVSKSLLSKITYQNKVITTQKKAVKQLKANVTAVESLVSQYKVFANEDTNLLGGSKDGTGLLDGPNARIVLDALPSKYDFPALTASLEKMLVDRKVKITGITGTDDEASNANIGTSGSPEPTKMNFSVQGMTDYNNLKTFIGDLERSIRPMNVTKLELSGTDSNVALAVTAETYYQPGKALSIVDKEVK